MKIKRILIHCLSLILLCSTLTAQNSLKNNLTASPVSLIPNVQIKYWGSTAPNAVRIVYDTTNKVFYSNTFNGDIYKILATSDGIATSKLFISARSTHTIDRVQGLFWFNNELFLAGNEVDDLNKKSKGRIIKFKINKEGNWESPQNILSTEYYPSSNILFDHNFSALCLNKTNDSLIIASGSRTDHGEVKDVSGRFPNLREDALTSKLFIIPLNASKEILLKNDINELKSAGYIFAEGVRNEFDIASNSKGEIFGVENSGDRDDPEELNLLKKGKHYGFPWNLGGNINPQQLSNYIPDKDLLLPSNLYNKSIFYNDPTFPTLPKDLKFEDPIQNIGPDANWLRDPISGKFKQTKYISTFTSHRSPLGLVFDTKNKLAAPFTGDGFVLAYSTGGGDSGYLNNVDSGADLCQMEFIKTSDNSTYQVSVKKIITGFKDLVDAVMVDNKMYILQNDGNLFEVTFPKLTATPSINITSSKNSIITGDKVDFIATVKDYWENAEYSWRVNGVEVKNFTSNFSSTSFSDGDKVTCIIKNYFSDGKQVDIISNTVFLTVKPIFIQPTLLKSGNCVGSNLSIVSNPITKVVWKKDGKEISSISNTENNLKLDSLFTQSPGIYSAEVNTVYGNFTTNNIEIFSNSVIPSIGKDSDYVLVSSEKWGNQWYLNNSALHGDTLQKYKVTTSGSYKLKFKNNFGCTSEYSNENTILILGTQVEHYDNIIIYPNPVNNQIKVQIPTQLKAALSMTILDNLGKPLLKSLPIVNGQIVSLEWLRQGSYYLVFTKSDGASFKTIKITKE